MGWEWLGVQSLSCHSGQPYQSLAKVGKVRQRVVVQLVMTKSYHTRWVWPRDTMIGAPGQWEQLCAVTGGMMPVTA
eukprot:3670496-Rhodomonas_salina.2